MNNQIDDTTHQPLVIDLLKTRITEMKKQVADKISKSAWQKNVLSNTHRKESLYQWDGSNNQNNIYRRSIE